MTAIIRPVSRKLFAPRFLVPLVLLVWLLILYSSLVLVPGATAQTNVCPSEWGDDRGDPTMHYGYYKNLPATGAMRGVKDPDRFTKRSLCQTASGKVTYAEKYYDGDMNIYVDLDSASQSLVSADDIKNLRKWTQAQQTRRHPAAEMLWESVPYDQGPCGDGSQSGGGLERARQGDTVKVTGALVRDDNHGYPEIHRNYQLTINGTTCTTALKDPV